MLFVEWEPPDIHWAMSHGQVELTVPQTRAVGEYFYFAFVAACLLFFRTGTVKLNKV